MKTTYNKIFLTVIMCGFITALFTGCVRDGQGDCHQPELYNAVIDFAYVTDNDDGRAEAVFTDHIQSVMFYLFDSDFRIVEKRGLELNDLKAFQGVKLALEPGDYYVVCWGNVGENTSITEGDYMSEFRLMHSDLLPLGQIYYAPAQDYDLPRTADYEHFRFTVPERGNVEKTIDFEASHRSVTITIVGYEDGVATASNPPVISLTNLPCGYNFDVSLCGDIKTYDLQTQFTDITEDYSVVTVYAPCFDIDSNEDIMIYQKNDGVLIYSYNLLKALQDRNIRLDSDDPINIRIEFLHGDVKVTITGWANEGIE